MVSFDALRASHVGAVSYLCKPGKPNELLACYPFSTFAYDISKYHLGYPEGYSGYSWDAHNTEHSCPVDNPWPIIKSTSNRCITYPCKNLDLSKNWSIDGFVMGFDNRCGWRIILGDLICASQRQYSSSYSGPWGLVWNGVSKYSMNLPYGFFAMTYEFTTSTIRVYQNGVLKFSVNQGLSGSVNAVSIIDCHDNNLVALSNLRVIQKLLGNNTSYPNQANLYTGFEPL